MLPLCCFNLFFVLISFLGGLPLIAVILGNDGVTLYKKDVRLFVCLSVKPVEQGKTFKAGIW